jgi:hypothetical protein
VLTPDQLDRLAAGIISGHEEKLVADLLRQLVAALFKDGELTVKELLLLETVSRNNRDALYNILNENRERIRKDIIDQVQTALDASDAGDVEMLSRYYDMPAPAGATAMFQRISQETAEGLAQIIARNNLAMVAHAEQVWYDVAAEAISAYNHGLVPMDTLIERAVRRLNREGVSSIDYASGVKSQADVAVRRHIVSQVGQAAGRMTLERMQQYGHDLVWVPGHFGARPEHAIWQGRAYCTTGTRPGFPDFVSNTRYGSIEGLLGVNCRHTFGPYFPGITEIPPIEKERAGATSDEYYELTQAQRSYERAIRATKRDIAGIQAAGGDDTNARLKLGRQQAKLRQHVADNNLVRQPVREKPYGTSARPRALTRRPKH